MVVGRTKAGSRGAVESGWLARRVGGWAVGQGREGGGSRGTRAGLRNDDGVEVGEEVKWRAGDGEVGTVLWPLEWEIHTSTHTQRDQEKGRRGTVCTVCVAEGAAGASFVSWRVGMQSITMYTCNAATEYSRRDQYYILKIVRSWCVKWPSRSISSCSCVRSNWS